MSYFKFAQRQVDSQINWSEIGKSMSDMLQEEAQGREAKKAEIDEASRQYGEVLSDAPTGDYDAGNTFALDYASSAQQYRLMQDRLLRQGQLSLRDYNIGRQNALDGTSNMFDLVKEYELEYKDKMSRWENDKSAFREVWEMEQAEGLGNLRLSRGYINPTNGTVSVGKMVKDEKTGLMKLSENPNDFATVNELRLRLKEKYDRFDVNAATAAAVDNLGVIENDVFNRFGRGRVNTIVTTIDAKKGDYTLEDEEFVATYKTWEDGQVSSMMVNPNDVASVLTDFKLTAPNGKRYDFTYDKEEFEAQEEGGELIFLDRSEIARGVPVFREEQQDAVEQTLRIGIRAGIDEKVQVKTGGTDQQKNQATLEREQKESTQQNALTNWDKLYWGTEAEKQAAADFISSINPSIEKIESTATGINIVYTDASGRDTRPLEFGDNQQQWAEKINFGLRDDLFIDNISEVYSAAGIEGNRELNIAEFVSAGIPKVTEIEAKGTFENVFKEQGNRDFSIEDAIDGIDMSSDTKGKEEKKAIAQFINEANNIMNVSSSTYDVRDFRGSALFGSGYIVTIDGTDYEVRIDGTKDQMREDLKPIKEALILKGLSFANVMYSEAEERENFIKQYGTVGTNNEGDPNPSPSPSPSPAPRP